MELPVKLKVHESVFVPLAKWAMSVAGNYRCVTKNGIRPIKEAVHSDLDASREMYNWVAKLCVLLGAPRRTRAFEKYAAAAQSLGSPSSAARALDAGAPNIERVDRLVQTIGRRACARRRSTRRSRWSTPSSSRTASQATQASGGQARRRPPRSLNLSAPALLIPAPGSCA